MSEGGREEGSEGGREGGREGRREGGREKNSIYICVTQVMYTVGSVQQCVIMVEKVREDK